MFINTVKVKVLKVLKVHKVRIAHIVRIVWKGLPLYIPCLLLVYLEINS